MEDILQILNLPEVRTCEIDGTKHFSIFDFISLITCVKNPRSI